MPMIISVVIKSISNMIIRIIVKIIKNTMIQYIYIFNGLGTTMAGFPNAVFFNEASTPDLSTGLKIWRIAHGFVPP